MAADVKRPQRPQSQRQEREANCDARPPVAATVRSRDEHPLGQEERARDLTVAVTECHSSLNADIASVHWAVAALLFLTSCTQAHYRRSADNDTYRIVQHVEARLFGKTNAFTIETPYSQRKPTDILPPELIEDRLQTNRRTLTLDAALDLAFSRSRAYQLQKETLYLTALSLTGARHAFSPQFFASSDARVEPVEGGATVHSQVGVSQLLKSGGSLSLTLANDIINDLLHYYNGDPQRSIVSTLSVNLVQQIGRAHV